MSTKIGLALGGGGARGLAHIGVLKVFEKENIPIYQVTGCSMGAIIGGAYAFLGDALTTEKFIRNLPESPAFKNLDFKTFDSGENDQDSSFYDHYLNNLKKYYSLLKNVTNPSVYDKKIVDEIFKKFPEKNIEDLPMRFACITTDLISGREIVLNEGNLRNAIIASASLPGVFPPVKIDNQVLIDGGFTDSIPVQVVKGQGAHYVIAVDVTKCIDDANNLDNALSIIYRAEDIVSYHLTQERLAGADLVIRPKVRHLPWTAVDQIDEIIAAGEQAAKEAVPQIRKFLTK